MFFQRKKDRWLHSSFEVETQKPQGGDGSITIMSEGFSDFE